MLLIEGLIITAVLFYVISYALKEQETKAFLKNYFICATATWIAEESCITLYGFYTYSPVWNFFIADVPLVVIIVWPTIIHSATALSSCLVKPNSNLIPLFAGCIVLTDAMLIEPISVNFNLWRWHLPGLFGVPLIGLFGWAYLAFFSVGFFVPINLPTGIKVKLPVLLAASVIGTHLFLLISYWTFFKWIVLPVGPVFSAFAVWIISAMISTLLIVTKKGYQVELKIFLMRLPAVIFFYFLLFSQKNSPASLIIYSFAFIPPYIIMWLKSYVYYRHLKSDKNISLLKKQESLN